MAQAEVVLGASLARGFGDADGVRWPLKRSADIFALNYGKALVKANRRPGRIPVFGTNGQCGWHDASLFVGPGVVLGRKGQGPLGVEWVEEDYWVIDTAYSLTLLRDDIDLKFAYYLIKYVGLNHLKDGTSNPSLSRDTFGAQLLPLPPEPHQRAIAHILGTLDDKIELNRQMNETLEAMARALFKSWFVDFDPVRAKADGRETVGVDSETAKLFASEFENSERGEIPKGWRVTTLGAEAERCGGVVQTGPFGSQLHASDYVPEGVPVIMPKDIAGRRVSTDSIARIREADADRLSKHRVQPGDLVYSRRGDVERHALIAHREAGWLCGTGCLLVRVGPNWPSPAFASLALDRPESRAWITQHAIGATMPNLNTSILSDVPLVVPPDELLAAFAREVDALEHLHVAGDAESVSLAGIRDSLLPNLISGQLSVAQAERASEATA
jgi:type I restriction enzyme S subunit